MAKVLISLPDELLARIDSEASRRGCSRSEFVREATRREVGWRTPQEIDSALARVRAALAPLGPIDAAAAVRESRDWLDARDRRR